MHIFRAFGFILLIFALTATSTIAKTDDKTNDSPKTAAAVQQIFKLYR